MSATVQAPPPPRSQLGDVADHAVDAAVTIACAVRDNDPERVWDFVRAHTGTQLCAIVITLAAMVPIEDASVAELLAWTAPLADRTDR